MSATDTAPNPARIRELNDAFRSSFVGGAVMVSAGVEALDAETKRDLLAKVRSFDTFEEGDDPHQEHDFGSITVLGERYLWKIDYYDRRCRRHSPDPSDPEVTTRVLTVMLASEY